MEEKEGLKETVYTIPTNFTDAGKLLGMFETKNVIEGALFALPLAVLIAFLVRSFFWKIFLMILIPFPILLLCSFGFQDESVTKVLRKRMKFKNNKRVMVFENATPKKEVKNLNEYKVKKKKQSGFDQFLDKLLGSSTEVKEDSVEDDINSQYVHPVDCVQSFLSIKEFRDGVVITNDGRYIKILEIIPINFLLRSKMEREGIIYIFRSFLKVAPRNMQIRIVSKSADISDYLEKMIKLLRTEKNKKCQELMVNYIKLLNDLRNSEAVTRKFYLIFSFDKRDMALRSPTHEGIVSRLNEETIKISKYFEQMGNSVVIPESWDNFNIDAVESILRKSAVREVSGLSE